MIREHNKHYDGCACVDDLIARQAKKISELRAENARYREALEFGLNEMMPEIKSQKGCWPGEVDDFEDRARKALRKE